MPRHEQSGLATLESLAGFVEDINNQALERLSAPGALEAAVQARFGPDVTPQDVTEALNALNDLSKYL